MKKRVVSGIAIVLMVLSGGFACRIGLAQVEHQAQSHEFNQSARKKNSQHWEKDSSKQVDESQEQEAGEIKRFQVSHPLMGVKFRFVVYSNDIEKARRGLVAAVERIEKLEACLSDYDPESEVSRLSREAKPNVPIRVSKELFEILKLCDSIWRQSKGSFDPTVGPLSKLWRKARRSKKIPSADQIENAKSRVGWENILLDQKEQKVTFKKAGIELDLGGIAKGYAADEAILVLKRMGMPMALVDAGGDVTVGQAPPGRKGWTIAINKSGGKTLTVSNASVATSGDLFQYLEHDGKRFSHIIDPKTGWGMTDRRLVTIVCRERKRPGTIADGWASALSVMPEDGLTENMVGKMNIAGLQIQRAGGKEPKTILEKGLLRDK